jgi:hypothetical protein
MANTDALCRACLYKCPEDDHGISNTDFQSFKYIYAELTLLQVGSFLMFNIYLNNLI